MLNETGPTSRDAVERIATILEAESLISIPISLRNRIAGQFYLTSQSPNSFSPAEAKAVYQMIARMIPIVDNLRLADRLASEATERERAKMVCDIHDSVIQPYLGIQLGLTALRRKSRGEIIWRRHCQLMEILMASLWLRRYMADSTEDVTNYAWSSELCRKFSSASGIRGIINARR